MLRRAETSDMSHTENHYVVLSIKFTFWITEINVALLGHSPRLIPSVLDEVSNLQGSVKIDFVAVLSGLNAVAKVFASVFRLDDGHEVDAAILKKTPPNAQCSCAGHEDFLEATHHLLQGERIGCPVGANVSPFARHVEAFRKLAKVRSAHEVNVPASDSWYEVLVAKINVVVNEDGIVRIESSGAVKKHLAHCSDHAVSVAKRLNSVGTEPQPDKFGVWMNRLPVFDHFKSSVNAVVLQNDVTGRLRIQVVQKSEALL